MTAEFYISLDQGITTKGPFPILTLVSMHQTGRLSINTTVQCGQTWLSIEEFISSSQALIDQTREDLAVVNAKQQKEDYKNIRKAGIKKLTIGVPALLAGLVITIGSIYQADSSPTGGVFIVWYGLIGFGAIETILGISQIVSPKGGYT